MAKTVIKFGKIGCAPCQTVENFLKEHNIEYTSINPFETEDVDLVLKHNITTIPVTVLLDEKGNVLARKAGFNEKAMNHLVELYHEA